MEIAIHWQEFKWHMKDKGMNLDQAINEFIIYSFMLKA